MKIFSVKDMKAQIWLKPSATQNTVEAMRSWEAVANENGNTISMYPNDFRLFEVGEFDEMSGLISVYSEPKDLGSAADYQRKKSS